MRCAAIALLAAMLAGPAQAITIDFDDLPGATLVGSFYPEATFTTVRTIANSALAQSEPNGIAPAAATGFNFLAGFRVDFTDPVNSLQFFSVADNDSGPIFSIDVFVNGLLSGTVAAQGDGDTTTFNLHDLGAFTNVTRIDIRDVTDDFGLAYDDFSFVIASAAISEPGALALLALGLAGLGLVRRRVSA